MDNEKEILLTDFFKSLRITINNCSIYFKEHPLFMKSIEKLHSDTLAVLNFAKPFTIGITPASLCVVGEYLEKEALYTDLAAFLHRRKIKNVEIRQGVTASEMGIFVTNLSLPVFDIFDAGGLASILEKQKVTGIAVAELDYSSLLRNEGTEQKDVWAYLLKRAVKEENRLQAKSIVENFDATLEKIKIADFLENENLRTAIGNFLDFLKTKERENFKKCAKVLVRAVSNSKEYTSKDKIKQLAFLASSLTPQDIANILCEEVASQETFNIKSIELFSSLLDKSQNISVAEALSQRLKKESSYNSAVAKKTKELLASLEESSVKMIYQYALGSLLADMGLAGSLSFDRAQIQKNYRTMLINLFAEENGPEAQGQIAEKIYPQIDTAFNENEMDFVRNFFKLMAKKINSGLGVKNAIEEIKAKADRKLEERLLCQSAELNGLIGFLSKTTFDKNFYLNKIFIEKDINYNTFGLFFNFFPRDTSEFYNELKSKNSDLNFLRKVVETLKNRDTETARGILKNIFLPANQFLKMEILKILRDFSGCDENFIVSILAQPTQSLAVKRQAMAIVVKNNSLRKIVAQALLAIPNRFGVKNKLIDENINTIASFDLIEARPELEEISKIKVFWKKTLKDSALKALNKWR